jgi:hypothetical protein
MRDAVLDNLQSKFGRILAARIYACALIQLVKMQAKADENETGDVLDISDAVRYTIGMAKRMRRQAIEHNGRMTWDNAVDRLEAEQVEVRRHVFAPATVRANIAAEREAYDAMTKAEYAARWSLKVEVEAEAVQERVVTNASEASDASLVIQSFMASLTRKRFAWFSAVIDGLRRGVELTRRQAQAIANRYTPEGVKTADFVELAVRYA